MMTRKTAFGIGVAIIIVLIVALVLHYPRSVAEVAPAQQSDSPMEKSQNAHDPSANVAPDAPSPANADKPGFTIKNRRPNPNAPAADTKGVVGPTDLENAREAAEMNAPGPTGSLPKEVIREAIDEIRPFIKECYEKMLVDFPSASGRITLEFDLEADEGVIRPSQAQILESGTTLSDEQMTECVVKTIGDLEIKSPTDSAGTVKVRYPFVFSSGSAKEVEE